MYMRDGREIVECLRVSRQPASLGRLEMMIEKLQRHCISLSSSGSLQD
jgi:hypothetical protein